MNYEEFECRGTLYRWSAIRNGEHPDFVLVCDDGEIWVQVERTTDIDKQDKLFSEGKAKYPISFGLAKNIISQIISKGYIESYFATDVGLIFSENGQLIEN